MNATANARRLPGVAAGLRLDRHELSGAFGDSGILFPLAASLVAINGLNPTVVFLGAGLYYIAAGLYFRLPMPVQPLKAFSAIAIAGALSPSVIAAGALILGAAYFLLGATRLINVVGRFVPTAVVKGIQLSLGIFLLQSAWNLAQRPQGLTALPSAVAFPGTSVSLGLLIGASALLLALVLLRWRLAPASVVVLSLGALLGVFGGSDLGIMTLGPVPVSLVIPAAGDWWIALTLLAIPQLPLSVGNAMISMHDVAGSYFGPQARRATLTGIAKSMGIANLAVGLFAGMPMCHGAGGMTAHHRFGARTAAATLVIGVTCLLLGLVFGQSALQLITRGVPPAILGALLAYVGWEHIQLTRTLRGALSWATCLIVAAVATFSANLGWGVVAGIAWWYAAEFVASRYARSRP